MTERRLPSVTNLLGQGYPKQQVLIPWAARFTAEAAYDDLDLWRDKDRDTAVQWLKGAHRRRTKTAQVRGTDVHALAEALIGGRDPGEIPDGLAPYVDQFCDFLATHSPDYVQTEATVYNLTHEYAGTLDGLATLAALPGLTLLDYKTTDKGPDEGSRPPYEDTALQLVAYARGEFIASQHEREDEGDGRHYVWRDDLEIAPMPTPDSAAVLVLSPVDWQLCPCRVGEDEWQTFLAVARLARWRRSDAKSVFAVAEERAAA